MIRFRFALCPLEDVTPWGDPPHWFGLTEGWYWIEVGGHELLRRTRDEHEYPYVDYYVVRLWEDLLLLTPTVLEPVPADLQPFIASERAEWVCDPDEFMTGEPGPDHPVLTAAIWYGEHYLDLGYLRNSPDLRFWRTTTGRDEITVDWRHEDDGEIGFTAGPAVRVSVPTGAYVDAVRMLDRDLVAAMGQRVEELGRRGKVDDLRREHEDRAQWRGRPRSGPVTDWEAVRRGARQLLGVSP